MFRYCYDIYSVQVYLLDQRSHVTGLYADMFLWFPNNWSIYCVYISILELASSVNNCVCVCVCLYVAHYYVLCLNKFNVYAIIIRCSYICIKLSRSLSKFPFTFIVHLLRLCT